ncbi:hypothetical protein KIKIMORA_01340 [Brevundimonas phage vB_BpoS-Kikimora]|uniref:Uncharacterized protein n=2 Tax=Kikimoravirus TaxID=3425051 RepID=A0A9E7N452_9CAUD|nr:hypothetical protein KIKIMORA_01340 [Brevundimonas phage vB_BpoS-Kikimora]UTC28172.1 hypothetical protein GURKE_01410 [Brevundimonas phage vB_BpoS-Gurke]
MNNLKLAEKIAGCGGLRGVTDEKIVSDLLVDNRDAIVKALLRPPAVAGPVLVETIEQIIYHHFYTGPIGGSANRLANALIDAFPALQGHEA